MPIHLMIVGLVLFFSDRALGLEARVTGGLSSLSEQNLSLSRLDARLELEPDEKSVKFHGDYHSNFSWLKLYTFRVPLAWNGPCEQTPNRQCTTPEELEPVASRVQLRFWRFTMGCKLPPMYDPTPDKANHAWCEFRIPGALARLFGLRLEWASAFTKLDFDLFPENGWSPNQRVEVDLTYEPGPLRGKLFAGHLPTASQVSFLKELGDPNETIHHKAFLAPISGSLRFTLHRILESEVSAPPLAAQSRPPSEDPKRGEKWTYSGALQKNKWDENEPDQKEKLSASCTPTQPSEPPLSATKEHMPDPSHHAPSESIPKLCFGACPSSYYVNTLTDAATTNEEAHLISRYGGDSQKAIVRVLKRPVPVVLVLASYQKLEWELRVHPETKIKRIFVAGFDQATTVVKGVPRSLVSTLPGKLYLGAWEKESSHSNESFLNYMKSIRSRIGLETSFQYRSVDDFFLVPFYRSEDEMKAREKAFKLVSQQSGTALPKGAIVVPTRGGFGEMDVPSQRVTSMITQLQKRIEIFTPFAVDEKTRTVYMITDDGIRNLSTGEETRVPTTMPPFNFVNAMEFDSKRNRILIVGRNDPYESGFNHYVYAFTPQTKTWSFLGKRNGLFIETLAYDAEADSFFATHPSSGQNGIERVWVLTPDLKVRHAISLANKVRIHRTEYTKLYLRNGILVYLAFQERGPRAGQIFTLAAIDPCRGIGSTIVESH